MKDFFLKPVSFSIRHPVTVMGLWLILTVFFVIQLPGIKIDTDPENMLSTEEPVRVTHEAVKKDFSLYDAIVVGVVDDKSPIGVFRPAALERIARISDEIRKIDGVVGKDLISPVTTDDIESGGGVLRIEPLMGRSVKDEKAALKIRDRALKNPVLRDLLVSGDGKAVALFVPIKEKRQSYRISKEIGSIVKRLGGRESYHITGLPVAEDTFGVEMFRQMSVSAPLAGLLIFILIFIFFRSLSLAFSSMAVAMITVIWTVGALIGAGFTVHIMSSMIPIFLMPIAVLDSIHILSDFHGRFSASKDRGETVFEVMKDLFTPMLYTSLTSAVGFASLLSTSIPPVRVFGAFVAVGIVIAWFITITFIPAYIMVIPERFLRSFGTVAAASAGQAGRGGRGYGIQEWLGMFSSRRAKPILLFSFLVFAVSIYGITKTTVNDNPSRWFHKGHPIRVAERVLNRHFGGTYMAYLVLEGGKEGAMKDPLVLNYVDRLQKKITGLDVVGKTTSITDVVKKVSYEINGEKEVFNRVPDTRKKIAQYLFLYEMSGDPDDLYHLVDPYYSKLNIWVQMKSGDNQEMMKVERFVDGYTAVNPPPGGLKIKWAGLTYLNVVWQNRMVFGMLRALAGGALMVFIMMALLFRSPLMGLISMIPLTLTVSLIYGLIGFAGKDYDMPIAVLSALTLGISIDFAIHFIQRAKQINSREKDWDKTVKKVFDDPVRAILRNMVVISMGFIPLFFSPLVPYQTVGFFFAAIMAVSGTATLVILPALMNVLQGRLRI